MTSNASSRIRWKRGPTLNLQSAFSPLAQGILLDRYSVDSSLCFQDGDHRKNSQKFKPETLTNAIRKLAKIKPHFGEATQTLVQIALQYVLDVDRVACVIPGFRNKKQVEMNLKALYNKLTPQDITFIKRICAE